MDNSLLRAALLTNAGFSSITGIIAVVMATPLEESLGPPAWSLRALGVGLLVFAIIVAREARAPGRARTWLIISADVAWVVTAVVAVTADPVWMTGTGSAVLIAITLAVGTLATAQWRGLANANQSPRPG